MALDQIHIDSIGSCSKRVEALLHRWDPVLLGDSGSTRSWVPIPFPTVSFRVGESSIGVLVPRDSIRVPSGLLEQG
jgi:hypothetical protein